MSFADRLRGGEFAVTLEITPPQRALPAVLRRRAGLLGPFADAVNVIQRPGRQSSLEASIELRAGGVDPVWHLVTRGAERASIKAGIARARLAGIHQVLCIRGDHAAVDGPEAVSIREAVALVREGLPGALVGATFNQYAPDRGAALRNLLAKLRAGAEYVQTQPVFDPEALREPAGAVREVFPSVRFVVMVVPLLSAGAIEGIQRRLAFRLPESLVTRLGGDPEAGWAVFAETIASLVASRTADGVAIMTTEMDPPAATGERIAEALRAAGIGCP